MAALVGLTACRGWGTSSSELLRVRIVRGPKDSTVFNAPAVVHPCRGGGALINAVSVANGVLVWIKSTGTPALGPRALLARADSTTPDGAVVAVRFLWHDVAHGLDVDSGSLMLSSTGAWYRGHLQGAGTDLAAATRTSVDITIDSLHSRPDSVACGAKL